jgi:hypothetical protein
MKFSKQYPNLSWWFFESGNDITLGKNYEHAYLITLYDEGGEVWNSGKIKDADEAMDAAEKWIEEWE